MGLENQFGSQEDQDLKRDYRNRDVEAVQVARQNIQAGKPAQVDLNKDNAEPSIFGIAASWINSGYNSIRYSMTGDEQYKRRNELNAQARSAMWKNYTWGNAISDGLDVLTIVAAAGLVATGVGAVGALSLSARVATRGAVSRGFISMARAVSSRGLAETAVEVTNTLAKTPAAIRNAAKLTETITGLQKAGGVSRYIVAPMRGAGALLATQRAKMLTTFVGMGATTSLGIGASRLSNVVETVKQSNEISDAVKANPNGSTREILEQRDRNRFGNNHVNVRRQNEKINQDVQHIQNNSANKPHRNNHSNAVQISNQMAELQNKRNEIQNRMITPQQQTHKPH